MVILGIDPGSTRIGYGLIHENRGKLKLLRSGLLNIKAKTKNERLVDLEKSFLRLLRETKPNLAVLEKLFFVKNLKTGLEVAQSRGILTLLIIKHKIPLLEFTPLEIKRAITGSGRADKQDVIRSVVKILKIKNFKGGADASDAIAAALTGLSYPLALKLKQI